MTPKRRDSTAFRHRHDRRCGRQSVRQRQPQTVLQENVLALDVTVQNPILVQKLESQAQFECPADPRRPGCHCQRAFVNWTAHIQPSPISHFSKLDTSDDFPVQLSSLAELHHGARVLFTVHRTLPIPSSVHVPSVVTMRLFAMADFDGDHDWQQM